MPVEDETFTGSDGLEYTFNYVFLTLTISGTGACTSVTSGKLRTNDSQTITIADKFYEGIGYREYRVRINEGVTSIGSSAFSTDTSLTGVEFADSVTSVGSQAFYNCTSLKTLNMGAGLTGMAYQKIQNCPIETLYTGGTVFLGSLLGQIKQAVPNRSYLKYLYIGTGCTTISTSSSYAIPIGLSLEVISIGPNVSSISSNAFTYCSDLKTFYVSSSNTAYIADNGTLYTADKATLMKHPPLSEVTALSIPTETTSLATGSLNECKNLVSITVDPENENYSSEDGVLYNKAKTRLLVYPISKPDTVYTMPSTVTAVDQQGPAASGLSSNKYLVILNLSASLNNFGGYYLLRNFTALKEINVSDENTTYKTIDGVLFSKNGTNLFLEMYPYNKVSQIYTVPEGCTSISSYAFDTQPGTITILNIPSTVTGTGTRTVYASCTVNQSTYTIPSRLGHPVITDPSDILETQDGFVYTVASAAKRLLYYKGSGTANVTAPDLYEGTAYDISAYAFYRHDEIISISLPYAQNIENDIITECNSLETIQFGQYAQRYPSGNDLYMHGPAKDCLALSEYAVASTNTNLYAEDGVLFGNLGIVNETWLLQYPPAKTDTAYVIPEGPVGVADRAFARSQYLKTVTLAQSLTSDYYLYSYYERKPFADSDSIETIVVYADQKYGGCEGAGCATLRNIAIIPSSAEGGTTVDYRNRVSPIWSQKNVTIRSITVSEGITQVIDSVTPSSLYQLSLPASLSIINPQSAPNLQTLSLYDTSAVSTISPDSSWNAPYLKHITIRHTSGYTTTWANGQPWANSTVPLDITIETGVVGIPTYAFKGAAIEHLSVPYSVTSIGVSAFEDSTGLTDFPAEYVTTIQASAFKNCADLESIDLSGVTAIGNEAFEGCTELTECDISSVTTLGTDAFKDCAGITTLTVPASVTTTHAFDGCTNITEITLLGSEIPVYGTTAAAHTPWYLSRANTPRINFPANLQLIGAYAFKDCSFTTESLDFSHLQAPVGTYAFANCSGPVNANISYGASSYAFANCTTLRAVAFSTAADIGEHAFDGAYNVGALALTGSAAQWSNRIGTAAFSFGTQSNPATVSVRAIANLFTTLDTTTYRGDYTTFTLIPQAIIGTDGLTYTIDDSLSLTVTNTTGTAKAISSLSNCVLTGHESGSSTNTTYDLKRTVTDMTVGQNITSISSSAMRGAQALRDVHLVDAYNIATFCFYESSIRSLTYDASSMSIGREAFRGCTSLTNVIATNSSATIGVSDSGFRGCTSLQNITQMGSISIMGYMAFAYCTAITTVPVGSNLAQGNFDAVAFSGCTAISTITVQDNPNYTVVDGVLYDASQTVLYMYPPMKAGTIFTVPSTVASINSQSFQCLQALLCVIIPSSVRRIYHGAFYNAISLIKVVFQGVFENNGSLFAGCYNLKDVEIREWDITTDFSPSDFYLGDAQHNASCVVYSPYNYAASHITSEPNSYTHIEFINILSEEYTAMGSTPSNPLKGVIIDVARFGGASLKYIDEGTLILASGGTSVVNYTGEDISVSVTGGTIASGTEGVTIGRGVISYTWNNSSAATTLFVLPLELTPSHEAIVFTSTGSGMWTLANTPYTSESLSAIIPLYEGAELNITDLSNIWYLLSGYDLQFTGPEDMSSIGLSKSSLGTKLSGTFINVPDAVDVYYAPFDVAYRQVPIIGSVQSAPIVFKIYKSPEICPISIGYSIDVPNDYSHGFYPISQVFSQDGERTEDYADPDISDSVTYDDTTRGTCRVTCSLPMLDFPYTPTTRTPVILIGWSLTRNGTEVKSYAADTTLTLQLNALTYGCALTARLAPATRIHYISSDSRTLAGSDILLRSTANAISYKLPAMETTESGYSVEQWSYSNANGADLYAYPSQTVSIVPDSVSGRTIDGTVYSHVVSLVGIISFLLKGDEPFIIVFDPAGGTFMSPGELTERGLPLPTATVSVNVPFKFAYDYTKKLWVWWAYDTANSQTKMDVTFANIPYDPASGLQPPAGIAMAKAWEISAPYFQSPDESPDAFTVPLKRSSTDSICQKTAYPEWIPDRTSHQRAILTAPGYGAIDLGNIQSINETYSSDVKQIPIVVYGYTRSFCMDLGVKKEMTINYIRTVPQVIDDTSGDSRDWSNAKWIEMLKNVMNRWQMRTNGNQLYLLRPNVEREGETPADPMSEYADEIYGVNCYISSLPIKYDQNPHIIAGSIDLSMGTLYPKTPEATPYIVKFRPDASTPWTVIENSGRFMNLLHPYNIKGWGGTSLTVKKEGDNWVFTGYVFKCWKDPQNHEYTFNEVVDISKLVDRGIALEFTADTDSISRVNGKVYFGDTYSNEDGSPTFKEYTARIVKGSNPGDTVDVLYGVVGGGGGGGAASIHYPQRVLGGGGGASGQFRFNRATWNYNGRSYIDISISCGCGGLGVPKYDYAGTKYPDGVHKGEGGHGGRSMISASSSGVSITAGGGGGGERGSVHAYNLDDPSVIALGGGNADNTSDLGGVTHTDGLKKGGNGGHVKGVEATAGDSYSTTASGRGGAQGQAAGSACGGGGGGGGFYYAGMEQYGFGNGGQGGGGVTTISYSGSYPTPVYQLETQNGGYGAGGGGGGGLVAYEGSSFSRYQSTLGGGNGGPGWAFICVISGGTLQ